MMSNVLLACLRLQNVARSDNLKDQFYVVVQDFSLLPLLCDSLSLAVLPAFMSPMINAEPLPASVTPSKNAFPSIAFALATHICPLATCDVYKCQFLTVSPCQYCDFFRFHAWFYLRSSSLKYIAVRCMCTVHHVERARSTCATVFRHTLLFMNHL